MAAAWTRLVTPTLRTMFDHVNACQQHLGVAVIQRDECGDILTYRAGMPVTHSYSTTVIAGDHSRVMVPVPFDPDVVWGRKPEHRVHGTVNGMNVRASVEGVNDGFGIVLGRAWRRDCGIAPGDVVDVVLAPEGPQRDDLADDIRAALEAEPAAGAFFDGLAQFYRRAYLRWIDATKRRPDERDRRIAEVIDLLRRGEKERP
jgi:hypothetical protein